MILKPLRWLAYILVVVAVSINIYFLVFWIHNSDLSYMGVVLVNKKMFGLMWLSFVLGLMGLDITK